MIEGGLRINSKNEHRPRVSVIAVVYNAASLLPAFLENVAGYLSDNVELIIKDGGSTDGTVAMLQQSSYITYWQSEKDKGIYDAMNIAIDYARGQWLYFMGADDFLLGGFTKALSLLQNPETVYYGKVIVWGEVMGKMYTRYDFTKAEICHQSIFYPKTVFNHYKYDLNYNVAADHFLNMQSFTDRRFSWQFIDELLAIYDTRGYSSQVNDSAFKTDYNKIIKQHLGLWTYIRYRFRKYKHRNKSLPPQ